MRKNNKKAKEPAKVSLYLDTRRKKDSGLFPVKIRVYDTSTRKARLYATSEKFDLSKKSFHRFFYPKEGQKLRREEKDIKENLEKLKYRYKDTIESLDVFTFERLEKSLKIKTDDLIDAFYHYNDLIHTLKGEDRISTASSYELSMKSLKSYLKHKNGKEPKQLLFQEININFLKGFERWMTKEEGKSKTTVGIYLRGLRVVFNKAIESGDIEQELYPFGKKRYKIPSSNNTKKAFNSDELSVLYKAVPQTPEQEMAKDFWFFSFVCNGMNIKDILNLKWLNVTDEQIVFYRAKTERTKSDNPKPIQVPLTEYAKEFIQKYGRKGTVGDDYVFPILHSEMDPETMHRTKLNFIRKINQHLKILAGNNNLTEDISTYWARHSFATTAIRKGASMEYASEALGHSDLKTTKNYFAGFEDQTKKEILNNIIDFMN